MILDEMTKDALEVLQTEKEDEYRKALTALEAVELEDLAIAKQIAELSLHRKNLSTALVQGKYSVRRIASEMRSIKVFIYKRLRND